MPHLLPTIVNFRLVFSSSGHHVHLFLASAKGIHASILSSLMHCFHLSIRHDWISAHEVDSLKDSNTSSIKALELDCLSVITCDRILLHVHNIVGKFDTKTLLAQNAWGVIFINSPKHEVMSSVGHRAFIPTQFCRVGCWTFDSKIIDPPLFVRGEFDIKSCIVNLLELSPIMKLLFIPLSLVLLQVKTIHTWQTNFIVSRASLDNLPLVTIIQLKVEISKACLSIKSCSNISQEG
mmetsp:Transcript_21043/g.39767  ORF Transcript_21043/g.39767 Transcript_21043/m.39767 type:complete len:236 (-) Transcript_21043:407-1114(-)